MSDRSSFDEAIAYITNIGNKVSNDYVFYLHMVSQCRVVIDTNLPAPAAVNFKYDHYNLYINPNDTPIEPDESGNYPTDSSGKEIRFIPGFASMPVLHRVGVIKHEMLHILYHHIWRKEERDHKLFNYATDCALNQHIVRDHLPKEGIYPDVMSKLLGINVPKDLTAEEYYNLFEPHAEKLPESGEGDSIDSHSSWGESEGDELISKDIAKSMLDKSIVATQRENGNIPSQYNQWLEVLSTASQVNWRQALRRIVGNKRVGVTPSIMRPNRRQPDQNHIKGKIKDRKYDLLVVADVSGSVADEELLAGLAEIRHICKLTQTSSTLIQIDTDPYPPEQITRNTRKFNRKASGGTILAPAIEQAKKYRINYNAVVVITDGGICESDIEAYQSTGKRIMWLLTSNHRKLSDFQQGKMSGYMLDVNK